MNFFWLNVRACFCILAGMFAEDDAQDSPLKAMLSQAGIAVTVQPVNQVGVIGGTATFGPVGYTTQIPVGVSLLWQIQTDGASSDWKNLVETAGYYEGVATDTLVVKALDNFLASRTTLNFRLLISYPGTAPVSSSSASLSIPERIAWTPNLGTNPPTERFFVSQVGIPKTMAIASPAPIGFSGPYTFLWTRVGGSAWGIVNANIQNPTLTKASPIAGFDYSVWTVTISNGLTTVTSDPRYFLLYGLSAAGGTPVPTTPAYSIAGASLARSTIAFAATSVWAIDLQINLRTLTPPTVTLVPPLNGGSIGFAISAQPDGGTAVQAITSIPGGTLIAPSSLGWCAGTGTWGIDL